MYLLLGLSQMLSQVYRRTYCLSIILWTAASSISCFSPSDFPTYSVELLTLLIAQQQAIQSAAMAFLISYCTAGRPALQLHAFVVWGFVDNCSGAFCLQLEEAILCEMDY